jgi:hypothetical protein
MRNDFVARFAALALSSVTREYPHKLDHVVNNDSDLRTPRELHPAFYGCFDWHSAVHGHWLLVHLLRTREADLDLETTRRVLADHLVPEKLLVETAYFKDPTRPSFERPYGWGWLLKLQEELFLWDDSEAQEWFDAVAPLAQTIVGKYLEFFPRQKYPIRAGTHSNSAFGLSFAWDYATTLLGDKRRRRVGELDHELTKLKTLIDERARSYYLADANYPAHLEPCGDDFLSPCLVEADLMRRVLSPSAFEEWLRCFLPSLEEGAPSNLLKPADITDRSDPKIVHLDGLNFSRAWCMRSIASTLSVQDPRSEVLKKAALAHVEASIPYVLSGDYAGEHWLATFAVYMLSTPE